MENRKKKKETPTRAESFFHLWLDEGTGEGDRCEEYEYSGSSLL